MDPQKLKNLLDEKHRRYDRPEFIQDDPISIPHAFSKKQDIEIMAFWAAVFAWGQRKVIINKTKEILGFMDGAPHDFILNHQDSDLKRFLNFKHRTFNADDALYFISFFKRHYSRQDSLEDAFFRGMKPGDVHVGNGLIAFREYFFDDEFAPARTRKHISSPASGSACKRLNMFLRWMVRQNSGVDFGLWQKIKPAQLLVPLDVHVERTAKSLGLLSPKQDGWKAVLELTEKLRAMDPSDPVKYDFALFGMGLEEKEGRGKGLGG